MLTVLADETVTAMKLLGVKSVGELNPRHVSCLGSRTNTLPKHPGQKPLTPASRSMRQLLCPYFLMANRDLQK